MKKKGQALVEFVLVFPIFLLIVTTIIELGSINYQRYKLEDNLDTVCEMYRKGNDLNDYLKANDLVADIKVNDDEVKIDVSKNVEIIYFPFSLYVCAIPFIAKLFDSVAPLV